MKIIDEKRKYIIKIVKNIKNAEMRKHCAEEGIRNSAIKADPNNYDFFWGNYITEEQFIENSYEKLFEIIESLINKNFTTADLGGVQKLNTVEDPKVN